MSTNLDAVEANDHRQALLTLLRTLADQLDNTESQVHAQLSAQYRGAWAELVALDKSIPQGESDLERIRRERAEREAGGRASADSA